MATLTGKTIASTYTSLLKLEGNSGSTVAGASGDAVQVKTGDNEATPLYLNTDRVGIGVSSPQNHLHIQETTDSCVVSIETTDTASEDSAILELKTPGLQMNLQQRRDGLFNIYDDTAGAARLSIIADGKVGIGTTAPVKALHVVNSAVIKGRATFTLTGTIDPAASTTVTGVNTLFLTEVTIGDDIVVSGETRQVTAIASNTSLTVATAFSDNSNDTSPDCEPAAFTVIRDTGDIGMVLDDDGFVGIGTAAPAYGLQVGTSTNNESKTIASYNRAGHSTVAGGHFLLASAHPNDGACVDTDRLGAISFSGTEDDPFALGTGATISAYAAGTWSKTGTYAHPSRLSFFTQSASTSVNGMATPNMVIDQDGKVGIGTDSPISALEVEDGLTTTGAVFTLGTKETTVVVNDVLGRINFYAPLETGTDAIAVAASIVAFARDTFAADNNSTGLYFQTGKSEVATTKMVIDEDGNVGIGTHAPDFDLEVRGAGSSLSNAGSLCLSTQDDTIADNNVLGMILFQAPAESSGTDAILPGAAIWGEAESTFAVDDNATAIVFSTDNSGTALNTSQERMRITSAGLVGIGTSSPSYNLDIADTTLTDGQSVGLEVTGTGNSVANQLRLGVIYEASADTNAPTAFIMLDASDGNSYYYFTGDDNNFYTTGTIGNIGVDGSCTLVGGQSSDERLKDISSDVFPYGLTEINALSPIKYTFKKDKKKKSHIGFGAQTTQSIIPESVTVTKDCIDGYEKVTDSEGVETHVPRSDDVNPKMTMEYVQIIPVLVKAVQELSAKVTALENA